MDAQSASVFGTTMEVAYGLGKVFAGPVCDNVSPKALIIVCLALASACNALMFHFPHMYYFDVFLWTCNGFVQAFIWPSMTIIFLTRFGDSKIKSTLYSILSTNQNLGSVLVPIVLTPVVSTYGW